MIRINNRKIGEGCPTYIIAEMSANHNQDYNKAVKIIEAAKEAGADAIKLQTFTADTHTIKSNRKYFQVNNGTLWDGRTLHDLYSEASMPWEWQPKLKKVANELGIDLFSAPVDSTSVNFLEKLDVPAYKIASFEIVDLPLIKKIAATGKPLIMSSGIATFSELNEAINTAREAGCDEIVLLKCTSSYPAKPEDMNLKTITHMSKSFNVPVGLSDHTEGITIPVAAIALGACMIEKHFTLSRSDYSLDSEFSLEPKELKDLVTSIRDTEKALGKVKYNDKNNKNRIFTRSLFVVENIKKGELFNEKNVRSIRPGNGLHTRFLEQIIGAKSTKDIERGTPMSWDLIIDKA